jgi:Putative DNA-binding domain
MWVARLELDEEQQMGRAEILYSELRDLGAIEGLIGQPEDSYLDCKEWPTKDDDAQKLLAKAACGMTNADGGILVIGMKAESRPKDEPDVVTAKAPVPDTRQVASRILGLISNLVEPGIVGVEVKEIQEMPSSKSGFVVVYVPKSEGSPRRSRKNREFYVRVGSSTIPMEYWQMEDQFGKRPHPRLMLYFEEKDRVNAHYQQPGVAVRWFHFGLKNVGRGIARFPGLRFARGSGFEMSQNGLDGNTNFGLPLRPSETEWIVFRGGVDDVIYPGEMRLIGILSQRGTERGVEASVVGGRFSKTEWLFGATEFQCDISGDGMATISIDHPVPEGKPIPGRM